MVTDPTMRKVEKASCVRGEVWGEGGKNERHKSSTKINLRKCKDRKRVLNL